MKVCIFTGPTISAAEAVTALEAVYFPPAAEGDVYRAALQRPEAIGIIDGYFQDVPSVRHKEILWAMSRGIHVFGSASIGALRATELAAFGMEGVGRVFEFYRDGILEDDDEVAVAHGAAELGFPAFSEAMVNIRQTLRKAEQEEVVSHDVGATLERMAKQLFYPERSYRALLHRASESGIPDEELARLHDWLPEGRVNQKREDALAMLRLIGERVAQGIKPKRVSFSFEHTSMWELVLRQDRDLRGGQESADGAVPLESLLDELRLQGEQYEKHRLLALERFFSIRETDRMGLNVTDNARAKAELAFRRDRDFGDATQVEQWMKENGLSAADFDALMRDEARVKMIRERLRFVAGSCLPDQLRLAGDYLRLVTRAAKKDRILASLGFTNRSLDNAGVTSEELLRWYFEDVRREPVPPDPGAYANRVGFDSFDAFRRTLLKEYVYRRFEAQGVNGARDGQAQGMVSGDSAWLRPESQATGR